MNTILIFVIAIGTYTFAVIISVQTRSVYLILRNVAGTRPGLGLTSVLNRQILAKSFSDVSRQKMNGIIRRRIEHNAVRRDTPCCDEHNSNGDQVGSNTFIIIYTKVN